MAYLSWPVFDIGIAEEMRAHLLRGDYLLLRYCKHYWMSHLEECVRLGLEKNTIDLLVTTLSRFLRARKRDASSQPGRLGTGASQGIVYYIIRPSLSIITNAFGTKTV